MSDPSATAVRGAPTDAARLPGDLQRGGQPSAAGRDDPPVSHPRASILVIDDNSPDGTGRIADELREPCPNIHVIHRPGKLGLGTATLAAMRFAIDHRFDYLLNLDADFSHPPRFIPDLLAGHGRSRRDDRLAVRARRRRRRGIHPQAAADELGDQHATPG